MSAIGGQGKDMLSLKLTGRPHRLRAKYPRLLSSDGGRRRSHPARCHGTLLAANEASMNRIMVVGNAGAGKSTFARRLGGKLALPVIHLDSHFWRPGWQIP